MNTKSIAYRTITTPPIDICAHICYGEPSGSTKLNCQHLGGVMTSFYPIAFFDYEEDPYEGFDDYDWEEESYQSSMGMFSMPCSDADEIEEVLQIQAYQQVLDMRGLREGMNAGHADRQAWQAVVASPDGNRFADLCRVAHPLYCPAATVPQLCVGAFFFFTDSVGYPCLNVE